MMVIGETLLITLIMGLCVSLQKKSLKNYCIYFAQLRHHQDNTNLFYVFFVKLNQVVF